MAAADDVPPLPSRAWETGVLCILNPKPGVNGQGGEYNITKYVELNMKYEGVCWHARSGSINSGPGASDQWWNRDANYLETYVLKPVVPRFLMSNTGILLFGTSENGDVTVLHGNLPYKWTKTRHSRSCLTRSSRDSMCCWEICNKRKTLWSAFLATMSSGRWATLYWSSFQKIQCQVG